MAAYPTTQAEIFGLVESMIAGYSKHPDDFPSVDIASLQNARDQYQTASAALTVAQAAAKQAANKKAEKLKQLQTITKAQLKRSQVDTMDNPRKLCFIGWGPKAKPQSMQAPRPPANLKIISQGIIGGEPRLLHLAILSLASRCRGQPSTSSPGRLDAAVPCFSSGGELRPSQPLPQG